MDDKMRLAIAEVIALKEEEKFEGIEEKKGHQVTPLVTIEHYQGKVVHVRDDLEWKKITRQQIIKEAEGKEVPVKTVDMKEAKKAGVVVPIKVGKDKPCPCGSGKKFKRCCMKK
jgi:uncharacterized protein YecA (UPF0149 family)